MSHTDSAKKCHPEFAEAFFQASKVLMAAGKAEKALPFLRQAIEISH